MKAKEFRQYLKDEHHKKRLTLEELPPFVVTLSQTLEIGQEVVISRLAKFIHRKKENYLINAKKKTSDETMKTVERLLTEHFEESEESDDSDSEIDIDDLMRPPKYGKFEVEITGYRYPEDSIAEIVRKTAPEHGPYGTRWFHDPPADDEWTAKEERLAKQFDKLRAVVLPEQRSPEWFAMRHEKITASDGGVVVAVNKYEAPYKFILKKTTEVPFISNKFCYHGKKHEEIATMIYCYRMNVTVEEFGLMAHPTIPFLGASPDGIVSHYQLDGQSRTKFVGRMLEIKCPLTRKIQREGEVYGGICPKYYWVQVQLQLECCDLDECDFWQCDIEEYPCREAFLDDTDQLEPFRSAHTGFEKGVLIQLLPKAKVDVEGIDYWKLVWDDADFIHPPKIEMTPADCDRWIGETISSIPTDPKYQGMVVDRVVYWRLKGSHNVTIPRDRDWFDQHYPQFEKMWGHVTFLREHPEILRLWVGYIDSLPIKRNKQIIEMVEKLCDPTTPGYTKLISSLEADCDAREKFRQREIEREADQVMEEFGFLDDEIDVVIETKVQKPKKKRDKPSKKPVRKAFDDDEFGFI